MKLLFREHRAYGRIFYYAECDAAQALCNICDRKSLQQWQLHLLRDNGFDVEVFVEGPEFE